MRLMSRMRLKLNTRTESRRLFRESDHQSRKRAGHGLPNANKRTRRYASCETGHPGVRTRITGSDVETRKHASPRKLVRLYPFMTKDPVDLVRTADFGGLLDIKCSMLQPKLCKYLMEHFNPTTCEFVFPGRGSIPVTEESVYLVLGVPRGNNDVRYEMDGDAISFMLEEFGHQGSNQPTMSSLGKKLKEMKQADNTYMRMWAVYAMCSVLAPTTGIHVSPRVYPSLVNIKEVKKLNVCKFVIKILRKTAKSREEKGILKACMLFCMVKYLDSLELNSMEISNAGTRVSVWTNAMVKMAISHDMNQDESFGRASLKAEFAQSGNRESASTENTHVPNEEAESPDDTLSQHIQHARRDSTMPNNEEQTTEHSILFSDSRVFGNFIGRNTTRMCSSDE